MSLDLVYYVHGITTDNEIDIATGWNPGELSENGIKRLIEAAKTTKTCKYDAIYCSDLNRAKQSAEILFGADSTPIYYDTRLRECNYGQLNGELKSKVIYNLHINRRFPAGESLKDVEYRIASFLSEIRSVHMNGTIAVVSHRAPQLALEVIVNNMDWAEAIASDWRHKGKWQLGWQYFIRDN